MDFGFNEEQEMLRTSARDFLAKEAPMTFVRKMMEDDVGFTEYLWKRMADLGWMGLILPEQYGGAGLDFVDLVVVLEEMGRVVLPGPFSRRSSWAASRCSRAAMPCARRTCRSSRPAT